MIRPVGVLRRRRLQAELWRVHPQSASRCSATTSTRSASSAARIDDIALLRAAILDCSRAAIDRDVSAPRIGFCRTPAWDERRRGDAKALIESTAAQLVGGRRAGQRGRRSRPNSRTSSTTTAASSISRRRATTPTNTSAHRDQVSQVLRDTVLTPGRELPLAAYVEAIETAETFRRHLDDIFADVDRAADPERRRRGARGLRLDRRSELQLDLDPGLDALRHAAGRHRSARACRSASSWSASASATKHCSTPPPG